MYEGKGCLMTGTRCYGVWLWSLSVVLELVERSRSPRAGPWRTRAVVHGQRKGRAIEGGGALLCQGRQGVLTWSLRRGREGSATLSGTRCLGLSEEWSDHVTISCLPAGSAYGLKAWPPWCSVPESRVWLCGPADCSTPGSSFFYQLLQFAQTHVHWVGNTIQQSHPLPLSSPFAFRLSLHQVFFQQDSSSHQVAKVLELRFQPSVLPVSIQGWPLHCSSKHQLLKCNSWFVTYLGMYIIKPVSGREFWEGMDRWKDWKMGSRVKEMASLIL